MKRLSIDFVRPGWRRTLLRTSLATWLVAAAGLLLCAMLAVQACLRWQALQAGQGTLAGLQLDAERQRRAPAQPQRIPPGQAQAVNRAISQMNLPWRALLDDLERITPDDIALLSLEPDAAARQLKCVAEARDSDAMLAYMERLKKSDFLESAILVHHEVLEQDPGRPLRFQFEAHWPDPES